MIRGCYTEQPELLRDAGTFCRVEAHLDPPEEDESAAVTWLVWLPLFWLTLVLGILLWHRRELIALWREPVLKHPVLIIESDDWGAGPVAPQAETLNRLVDVLTQYKDYTGRHPVMTLGLVLAVPDGPAIRATGQYHRLTLEHPMFTPVLAAIERGRRAGVFALQLHGLEHYWPPALVSCKDPAVQNWLQADPPATTEQLPAHLQSRWTDASVLPSRPLPAAEIARAAHEEVALFERVFGERPRVAVPPTFVWNEVVEAGWADAGIEVVVTPGLRSECRNAVGLPACDRVMIINGQHSGSVRYVVRDDYFEPERGHCPAAALKHLAAKQFLGRPCLLEHHRSNYLAGAEMLERALQGLHALLAEALRRYPDLRFCSTHELVHAWQTTDAAMLERGFQARISAFCARVQIAPGLRRWAKLTGLYWLFDLPRVIHLGMRSANTSAW